MASEIFQVSDFGDAKIVVCPDYFDIAVANEFHGLLCQLVTEKPAKVIFDVDKLETVDTSILQTLCAFMQDANQQQIDVEWKNSNEALTKSANLLGIDNFLRLDAA